MKLVGKPVAFVTIAIEEKIAAAPGFLVVQIGANIAFTVSSIQRAIAVAFAISKLTLKAVAIGEVVSAGTVFLVVAKQSFKAIAIVKD